MHRSSLFGVLYDEVLAAGIAICTGHEILGFYDEPDRCGLVFDAGVRSRQYDLVVDASGWASRLASDAKNILAYGALWATLPLQSGDAVSANVLEQRYRRAAQMAGVLPIGRRTPGGEEEVAFFWSLRGRDHAAWLASPIDIWKAKVLALWPELDGLMARITCHADLTFARYSHRTKAQSVSGRSFAIGDAWHSASPQLGQGANMALLDAWALAAGLREGRCLAEGLRLARAWRSGHVQLYQALTGLLTPLYQSDAKWPAVIRDRLLAPLSRMRPITRLQASLMSGLFGWPLASLGLEPPDYAAIASSIAPRTCGSAQSRSPVTRQTSLPLAS